MQSLDMEQPVQVHVESDLADLIPTFVENRKKDMVALEGYIQTKDFEEIRRLGHTLKGICAPYGFEILGDLARELEQAAKDENVEELESLKKQMVYVINNHEIHYEED